VRTEGEGSPECDPKCAANEEVVVRLLALLLAMALPVALSTCFAQVNSYPFAVSGAAPTARDPVRGVARSSGNRRGDHALPSNLLVGADNGSLPMS